VASRSAFARSPIRLSDLNDSDLADQLQAIRVCLLGFLERWPTAAVAGTKR
jgi:hypothetical protein